MTGAKAYFLRGLLRTKNSSKTIKSDSEQEANLFLPRSRSRFVNRSVMKGIEMQGGKMENGFRVYRPMKVTPIIPTERRRVGN